MKKTVMWGLVAVMAVIGFASTPGQAKEPSVRPLDGKTAVEGYRGYRGYRGPRRGGYYGPRYGGSWGPRYHRPYRRYYAPPPVVYAPPPVVYYGGTVGCY